jgi:hypothetical protein
MKESNENFRKKLLRIEKSSKQTRVTKRCN